MKRSTARHSAALDPIITESLAVQAVFGGGKTMSTEDSNEQSARDLNDEFVLDEFVPITAVPRAEFPILDDPRSERVHRDQHAEYTHELTDDASETSARTLVRMVPVVYGASFGVLADNLMFGFSAGLALSLAFDLSMGSHSMLGAAWQGLLRKGCPLIAGAARWSAYAMERLGFPAPTKLIEMRCRVSAP
jgi:hypothetical protein